MDTLAPYRTEIESLHRFFVEWYAGERGRDTFEQLEDALAPSFEIISPNGDVHDREEIMAAIRESFDSREPGAFSIEIRNVELVAEYDEVTLVRYEEWQDDGDERTGRLSSGVFGPARESTGEQQTVEWRYLQETWLEDGE